MKCYTLFSSSSGNCIYLEENHTRVLIDAGGSMRRVQNALASLGVSLSEIRAILVTHEHSDHTSALAAIAKNFPVEIYCQKKVAESLYLSLLHKPERGREAASFARAVRTVICGDEYAVDDLRFTPFQTPHDSVDSAGFIFGDRALGVATDLGHVSDEVENALIGCKHVILESNHDLQMLRDGPYPVYLKERVASDYGHLNNSDSATFCARLLKKGCENFTLYHLSKENNTPALALSSALDAFHGIGGTENKDFHLRTASPQEIIQVL